MRNAQNGGDRSMSRRNVLIGAVATAGLAVPAAVALLLSAAAPAAVAAANIAPGDCEALQHFAPPGVRITAAAPVLPQPAWTPGPGQRPIALKAALCRVQGVIEKEMEFELWLPQPGAWNGKFLGAGVGGDAGAFNLRDLPRGVARGYAAATTDTGHKASDPAWMMGDPDRLANYTHRANHLLAEASKAIVATYYARPARLSYFIGCSGGGRQALKEMQLYPTDYDGIIAGAPGPKTPEMTVRRMWELLRRDARPGLMSPADWKLVADEGVRTCDAADGVVDGVAEDPRSCKFDPAALQCGKAPAGRCLSAEQVDFARGFYQPLKDEAGRAIDQGLLPGVLVDSGRSRLAPATFGQAVRRDANWSGAGFSVAKDLAAINTVMPELGAGKTEVSAFQKRGGKIILYQGWMDPAVAGRMTLAYYQDVAKALGPKTTQAFMRLYMVPGMGHCAGGPGADQFGGSGDDAPVVDPQHALRSALEQWVEQGRPPAQITASKIADGKVVRTHLLCPAPAHARYNGKGSTDDAASYTCVRG